MHDSPQEETGTIILTWAHERGPKQAVMPEKSVLQVRSGLGCPGIVPSCTVSLVNLRR
jgi:hypothetical protein